MTSVDHWLDRADRATARPAAYVLAIDDAQLVQSFATLQKD